MRFIASFLAFILVRIGYANGDELYPIFIVEDIAQNQPEWSSSDYIEPLQEKPSDEAFLVSSFPQSDRTDDEDLAWIKTHIVDRYNFKKDPNKDMWISQPNFKNDLGTSEFNGAAGRVQAFFQRNNDWEATKRNPAFRTKDSCTNLLYITAARYLLVTDVLYKESREKLAPCSRTSDKKIEIPVLSGVCYPEPYGTASCTSDYDVGLIGKDAGVLTEKFNLFFQNNFGKPSELVFDTNVYAFTLEVAMPLLFKGLPTELVKGVAEREQSVDFKMQELASAYYKVFKYNEAYFNVLKDGAVTSMVNAPESKVRLVVWLEDFSNLNKQVAMRPTGERTLAEFRREHNEKYQEFVKKMSEGGYNSGFIGILSKALMYAAEAYHTRGAIRHVVGGTQMKIIDTSKSLTKVDLWVSMIENWGEANKEYTHCGSAPLEVCFLKMSKYMWRMFNAMRLLRDHIPASEASRRPELVHFGEKYADPEFAMKMWLDYKKQGATAIPKQKANVMEFLRQFDCNGAALGQKLPETCVNKMNDKVNAYNQKLASLQRDKAERPPWRP